MSIRPRMDVMTSKILCPTDGSDHATVGVILAAEVAKATGGALRG